MNAQYVLLTAAKDEEASIADTIYSVLRQTVLPLAWFIMDDGSRDRTAAIIKGFADRYSFIHLQTAGERAGRDFGSQYKAIMAAYELARSLEFDYIAVADADQAPQRADHFEALLNEFRRNPRLGLASGYLFERYNGTWECRRGNSLDSVAGGSAIFRRECFEQAGGYTPLYYGGSDWLIQLEARIAGWEILVRPDLPAFHYRPTSSAGGIWRGLFRAGLMDASFGSHPLFEFCKCCRRVTLPPLLLGSIVRFSGFCWWNLSGRQPLVPPQTVAYLRTQQVGKLWRLISRTTEARAASGTSRARSKSSIS